MQLVFYHSQLCSSLGCSYLDVDLVFCVHRLELPLTCNLLFVTSCRRVRDIIAESKGRHTERSISARLFLPKIYSQISRRNDNEWMGSDRITSILNGAKAAVEKFNQGYKDDAMLKCAVAQVDGITKEEVN